jgi:hypothetical protein
MNKTFFDAMLLSLGVCISAGAVLFQTVLGK